MIEWIVTPEESGSKLLAFLIQRLEGKYSARFLKRLIEHNSCLINGRTERFASTFLGKGDHIRLYLEHADSQVSRLVEPSRILFEDEALLIYNKPAGINCDEKGILQLWKSPSSSLQLVHRLDRDTTGVLILAKQGAIFDHLVKQFKQFQVHKRYLAIVDGAMDQAKGKIENYLGKKKAFAGQTIWGKVSADHGLYACTEWDRLKRGQMASLVACYPKTGRTHQIRIHMAEMGHPILGDFQYGKLFQCSYRPQRVLLHAENIQFYHPLTEIKVNFIAPLPDDFKIAEQKLFKGVS
jgi:23S rRNA pseudouridine955/2504/2580 synthase/23S rRNA pseudouridine1911/1915/1917 synthase